MKRTIKEQLRILVKEHERGLLPTVEYRRLRWALLDRAAKGEDYAVDETGNTRPRDPRSNIGATGDNQAPDSREADDTGRAAQSGAQVVPEQTAGTPENATIRRSGQSAAGGTSPTVHRRRASDATAAKTGNGKLLAGTAIAVVALLAAGFFWMSRSSDEVVMSPENVAETHTDNENPAQTVIEDFSDNEDWTPGSIRRFTRDWEDISEDDRASAKSAGWYREFARDLRDRLKLSEMSDNRRPSATTGALRELASSLGIRVESRFADADFAPPVVATQAAPRDEPSAIDEVVESAPTENAVDEDIGTRGDPAETRLANDAEKPGDTVETQIPVNAIAPQSTQAVTGESTNTSAKRTDNSQQSTPAAEPGTVAEPAATADPTGTSAPTRSQIAPDAQEAQDDQDVAEAQEARNVAGAQETQGAPDVQEAQEAPGAQDTPAVSKSSRKTTCNLSVLSTRRKFCRDTMSDGSDGFKLAIVRPGTFQMGSAARDEEQPVRGVTISQAIAVGVTEVSFAQYERYCRTAGTRCPDNPWGDANLPVVNISWEEARNYTGWLSAQTGHTYRLPSESEWEYFARGGTTTEYPFGDEISYLQAHFSDTKRRNRPVEVNGALIISNKLGLKHVVGNVGEWVEDAWYGDYSDAPSDQRTRVGGANNLRVVRGGSYQDRASALRSAARASSSASTRAPHIGFRVAREIN